MEDKTKFKNWKDGDVFALKIDNGSKYDGRYILLEVHTKVEWGNAKTKYFRSRLTKDTKVPKTIDEIENAAYVKVFFEIFSSTFHREGFESFDEMLKKVELKNYELDEYGYLYTYYFEIYFKRANKNNLGYFIYLGNFDYPKRLRHERIPCHPYHGIATIKEAEICEYLLESYEKNNLRNDYAYTEEGVKKNREKNLDEISFQKNEFNDLIMKLKNNEIIEPILPEYGWGPKLYDIDLAYEYKEYFKQVYSEEKTMDTMCKELSDIVEEETKYNDERTIFWMVIADNFLKKGIMKQELKDLALKCIRLNLKLWKPHQDYKEREKELNKLKKRLEEYECKK